MTRNPAPAWFVLVVPLVCAVLPGCRNIRVTRPYLDPPPADLTPTVINYVDHDGFDTVFETLLLNQEPVILIQTATSRPDWGPRLNAWIAAWNRGGKVAGKPRPTVRMQSPLSPVTVNGDTLREFRLLIDDLMKHIEDLARRGSTWWAEERTQRRRIALLRPYSLRFHLDGNGNIQLIFFNGRYSQHYRRVMESMAVHDAEETGEWSRAYCCSHCKLLARPAPSFRAHLGSPE